MEAALSPASIARRDYLVIGVVGFAHGTSHFFHLMIPPLFPWLMRDFGFSFTEVGLLMTVFFVVSGIGQALAGFVVDRHGARPVLTAGIALLACSGVALGGAQNYLMLLFAAALAGLGNSVFHPADFTLLNRRVSQQRLGHAFSVHGLAGNLGWALGPVFMTGIAAAAGWRMAAYAAAGLGLAALALVASRRELVLEAGRRAAASSEREAQPSRSTFEFLHSPVVWLCFLFFLLSTMAFGALQNFLTPTLQQVYGLSLPLATSCLTAFLLGSAGGIVAGGFLASREVAQERLIAIALFAAALVAAFVASGMPAGWSLPALLAIMGFCVGSAGPSRDLLVRRAATSGAGVAAFGRVYGFVYSGLDAGLATAPLVFGWLMDAGAAVGVLIGVAALQVLALGTALRVGRRAADEHHDATAS
jgi:predicted MFS family arabinose efflux permease